MAGRAAPWLGRRSAACERRCRSRIAWLARNGPCLSLVAALKQVESSSGTKPNSRRKSRSELKVVSSNPALRTAGSKGPRRWLRHSCATALPAWPSVPIRDKQGHQVDSPAFRLSLAWSRPGVLLASRTAESTSYSSLPHNQCQGCISVHERFEYIRWMRSRRFRKDSSGSCAGFFPGSWAWSSPVHM